LDESVIKMKQAARISKSKLMSRSIALTIGWCACTFLTSIPQFRATLAAPLVVTDTEATGEVAYVMAGGSSAYKEQLSAGADLWHMGRVQKVILTENDQPGSYNFMYHRNWTVTEWGIDLLQWLGVPARNIEIIKLDDEGKFGSLREARNVAKHIAGRVHGLVVVTSAAHTRRSLLAFKRTLPNTISVVSYAASSFADSAERYRPLWLEYLKLGVYELFA